MSELVAMAGIVFLVVGGAVLLALIAASAASALAGEWILDKMNTEVRVLAVIAPVLTIIGLTLIGVSGV